jgi:hypothetical protein
MDETPLAQVVVAIATKWTGEEALLFVGAETDTAANAGVASIKRYKKSFMTPALVQDCCDEGCWLSHGD